MKQTRKRKKKNRAAQVLVQESATACPHCKSQKSYIRSTTPFTLGGADCVRRYRLCGRWTRTGSDAPVFSGDQGCGKPFCSWFFVP